MVDVVVVLEGEGDFGRPHLVLGDGVLDDLEVLDDRGI